MKIGQKKQLIAEVQNKTFYNINESYSPSIASFSYFVTFDVLKTPLMLRADKIDKQNEWCSKGYTQLTNKRQIMQGWEKGYFNMQT